MPLLTAARRVCSITNNTNMTTRNTTEMFALQMVFVAWTGAGVTLLVFIFIVGNRTDSLLTPLSCPHKLRGRATETYHAATLELVRATGRLGQLLTLL
jgi:hypothetical protein